MFFFLKLRDSVTYTLITVLFYIIFSVLIANFYTNLRLTHEYLEPDYNILNPIFCYSGTRCFPKKFFAKNCGLRPSV